MGIFRKLRSSSSTPHQLDKEAGPATPTSPNTITTKQDVASPSSFRSRPEYGTASSRKSVDRVARPALVPTSPSNLGSTSSTSKISRKPWKRSRGDQIAGPAYQSPETAPPSAYQNNPGAGSGATPGNRLDTNAAIDDSGDVRKRNSMVYVGPSASVSTKPLPASPESSKSVARLIDLPESPSSAIKKKNRISSGEFQQDGGILGRLGFEKVHRGTVSESGHEAVWLPDEVKAEQLDETTNVNASTHIQNLLPSPLSPQEQLTPMNLHDISGKKDVDTAVHRTGEEMEVLESAEKKHKFWKGKGRLRRISRAASDLEDFEPSDVGSPTPKKAPLPPSTDAEAKPVGKEAAAAVELHHPRPQPMRRLSSNVFQNPFHRSSSRTSFGQDIDIAASGLDDGSFQLKSFRHVSGTSDVEVPDGLEDYFAHLKKTAIAADTAAPKSPDSGSIEVTHPRTSYPPVSYPCNQPKSRSASRTQLPLPRPPSVTGSISSMDELFSSTGKISAAAFRKGIRRPSETIRVASDTHISAMGSKQAKDEDDDDDDDMPLAMKPRKRSGSSTFPASRMDKNQAVTHALSVFPKTGTQTSGKKEGSVDAKGKTTDNEDNKKEIERTSSVSPSLSFNVLNKKLESPRAVGTSKFVVKSATTTRHSSQTRLHAHEQPSRPTFEEPVSSTAPSPAPPDEPEIILSPLDINQIERTMMPPILSPDGKAAPSTEQPRQHSSLFHAKEESKQASPAPRPSEFASPSTSVRYNTPPPVEPVKVPEAGDTTPTSIDLPLPPDQMPPSPPPLSALPSRPSSRAELGKGRKMSLSMLEEPLRVISGLWSGSPPDTIARIPPVTRYLDHTPKKTDSSEQATNEAVTPARAENKPKAGEEDSLESWIISSQALLTTQSPRATRKISRATLFDASLSENQSAQSEAENGGNAKLRSRSSTLSLSNASLSRQLATGSSDKQAGPSIATKVPTPIVSSFSRSQPPRPKAETSTSHLRGRANWSSSESDSDTETESEDIGPRRKMGSKKRQGPKGPRKPSNPSAPPSPVRTKALKGRDTLKKSSTAKQKAMKSTDEAESSSDEEALSRLRERTSKSSLSSNRVLSRADISKPKGRDGQSSQVISQQQSKETRANSFNGVLGVEKGIYGASASPGSSRSGMTSETFGQQLVTPRDSAVIDTIGNPNQGGYESQHLPQDRSRTASFSSNQVAPYPSFSPPPMHHTVDPNSRTMMKQAWQAHYMAAAFRASEEEWERASSIGGETMSSMPTQYPPQSPYPSGFLNYPKTPVPPQHLQATYPPPAFPTTFGYLPMQPSQGFQPGYQMPQYPLPYPGAQYPPFSPSLTGPPTQFSPSEVGGYSFGPGSQSVFGGDFGPPTQIRQPQPHPLPQIPSQGPQGAQDGGQRQSWYGSMPTSQSVHSMPVYDKDTTQGSRTVKPVQHRRGSSAHFAN